MDDLVVGLLRLGFKQQEAEVYVALLGQGSATAGFLAQKTGIPRTTTYGLLRVLVKQGLVTEVQHKERIFMAESPDRIRSLLSYQIRELEQKRSLADQLMMRLQVFHNTAGAKPKIRYIESIQGLRIMQQEYESRNGDLIQIMNYDRFMAIHDPQLDQVHQAELKQKNRHIRTILVTDRTHVNLPKNFEVILVPTALAPIEGEMTVCEDRLVLFAYAPNFIAVEIQSQAIASTAQGALELAWNEARRIGTFHN